MGFLEIRSQIIDRLREGRVQHEARNEINVKNLLAVGEVRAEDVVQLLKATKGFQYETSPHHVESNILVHIFKPEVLESGRRTRWYVKCYLLEPDVWFISVHRSQGGRR